MSRSPIRSPWPRDSAALACRLRPQYVTRLRPWVPRRRQSVRRSSEDAFHPRGIPTAQRSFHSVNQAEREFFLDTVRRTPAQLRSLLAQLDGAVDVVRGSEACLSADAREQLHGERASVGMMASATREVIVHELGHVVFDLALDERGVGRSVLPSFERAGETRRSSHPPEQFADQLAHWALDERSTDPRWLSLPSSRELPREHASYCPLSARGLLPR